MSPATGMPTPEEIAEAERAIAAAADHLDEIAEIPAGDPQTFREMTYYVHDQMRTGELWVGWHADGVPVYGDVGTVVPGGVELLPADHPDTAMIAGVMVMQLIADARAKEAVGSSLIIPGRPNRAERRAQARRH